MLNCDKHWPTEQLHSEPLYVSRLQRHSPWKQDNGRLCTVTEICCRFEEKMQASWSEQTFRQQGDTASGPCESPARLSLVGLTHIFLTAPEWRVRCQWGKFEVTTGAEVGECEWALVCSLVEHIQASSMALHGVCVCVHFLLHIWT